MQSSLASLWKTAREGHLSPFEQLKALAYREAFLDAGFPEYGPMTKTKGCVAPLDFDKLCPKGAVGKILKVSLQVVWLTSFAPKGPQVKF